MKIQIEICDGLKTGEIGYLVKTFNQNTTREYLRVQSTPARKNLSGEECVEGWLGDTDNVSKRAMGRAKILSVTSGPFVGDPEYGTVEAVAANDLAEARRNSALPSEKTSPPLPPATGSPSSESPHSHE